jgi:hypothetical protein
MGLSFTIAAGPRQRSHCQVRVPRDTRPQFTVSDSRLPQLVGPGSRIYILQEEGGPVIPPGTGFPFHRFLRLAGPPRCTYWSSPQTESERSESELVHRPSVRLGDRSLETLDQSASRSWNKAPIGGLRPCFYYYHAVASLLMWGAFSDERTRLSFTGATGSSPAHSFSGPSPVDSRP